MQCVCCPKPENNTVMKQARNVQAEEIFIRRNIVFKFKAGYDFGIHRNSIELPIQCSSKVRDNW